MDRQSLAAGETEELDPFMQEMLKKVNEQSRAQGHSLEYLEGVLDYLLTRTRAKLTDKERVQWMMDLSKFPKWRLVELDEYEGPLTGQLLAYLHGLRRKDEVPSLPQLPAPKIKRNEHIARDFNAVVKRITDNYSRGLSDAREREIYEWDGMKKAYPTCNFDYTIKMRQQDWNRTTYTDRKTVSAGE